MTTTITPNLQADVVVASLNALNDAISMPALGTVQSAGIDVSGTFVGTISFEGTVDGITWRALTVQTTAGVAVLTTTVPNTFVVGLGGLQAVRTRFSAYTSGSAVVTTILNGGWLAPLAATPISGGISNTLFFNDSSTAQGASAVFTGAFHDSGTAAGGANKYSKFNAMAVSDQNGNLQIQCSNDNVTWRSASGVATAYAANGTVNLSVPVTTRYYRVVHTNGAIAQTFFMCNSSFTAA